MTYGGAAFDFTGQLSAMARDRMGTSEIGEIISLVAEHGALSFGAGEPSADMSPREGVRAAIDRAFRERGDIWGYHHDEFGLLELREWIARRMTEDDMAPAWMSAKDVILTNGGG